MVSVRYVQPLHPSEGLMDRQAVLLPADPPDPVGDAVRRDEVIQTGFLPAPLRDLPDLSRRTVSEKDRAGLRPAGPHMPGPVLLLFRSRVLVSPDHAVSVIVRGHAGRDPCLDMAEPFQLINIITGLRLFLKAALLHPAPQKRSRPFVKLLRRGVCSLFKLGLRPVHCQKGVRFPPCFLPRFLPAYHVIGQGRYPSLHSLCGPPGPKRSYLRHFPSHLPG